MYEELKLTDIKKEMSIKESIEFLVTVHPFLLSLDYPKEMMELKLLCSSEEFSTSTGSNPRPFMKLWKLNSDLKNYKDKYLNSDYLLDFDESMQIELFNNHVNAGHKGLYYYINKMYTYLESPYNIYYSLFTEKNDASSNNKTINTDSTYRTQVLPMDIDINNYKVYCEIKNLLKTLEIELLTINSGHGYQCLILLDAPTEDKQIFEKFTNLLLRKGFPIDSKIKDSARIFRIPGTWNVKKYNTEKYKDEEPPLTYLVNTTKSRYSLEYVFSQIETLEDIEPVELINEYRETIKERTLTDDEKTALFNGYSRELIAIKFYDMCDFKRFESAPRRMLQEVHKGIRHNAIYALEPYLRNTQKMKFDDIMLLFQIWNRVFAQTPLKDIELNRFVRHSDNNQFLGYRGHYPDSLFKKYGTFRIPYAELMSVEEGISTIRIPALIFKKLAYKGFWDLSKDYQLNIELVEDKEGGLASKNHASFKIYILLKVEMLRRVANGLPNFNEFTIQEIMDITKMGQATIYRNLKDLLNKDYGLLIKKNVPNSNLSFFYALEDDNIFDNEFIDIDINFIENALFNSHKKTSDSEFKLLMFIKFYARYVNQNDTVWLSQKIWGGFMSMERTLCNKKLSILADKGYLSISMKEIKGRNGSSIKNRVTLLKTIN